MSADMFKRAIRKLSVFRSSSSPSPTEENSEESDAAKSSSIPTDRGAGAISGRSVLRSVVTESFPPLHEPFGVDAEYHGFSGWPAGATVFSFHQTQGVLCVGTSCGAVMVYGKGFQLEHLNRDGDSVASVTAIKPVGVDTSVVCYSDNSIAVFKLPRLLQEDRIAGTWLDSPITSLHVDEFTEKTDRSYVYVGTVAGGVYVLEVGVDGKIRVVDYSVTLRDAELSGPYAVKAVLSDEKCLAIAYAWDGAEQVSSAQMGAVVVYHLTKRKIRHSYSVHGYPVSMEWNCSGDALYVALKSGEILSLTSVRDEFLSKVVWMSSTYSELDRLLSTSGAEMEGDSDRNGNMNGNMKGSSEDKSVVTISRIRWLAQQTESTKGCLYALLECRESGKVISTAIVGLIPSGQHGEMTDFVSYPSKMFSGPVHSFEIVPLLSNTHIGRTVPGILLMIERPSSNLGEGQLSNTRNLLSAGAPGASGGFLGSLSPTHSVSWRRKPEDGCASPAIETSASMDAWHSVASQAGDSEKSDSQPTSPTLQRIAESSVRGMTATSSSIAVQSAGHLELKLLPISERMAAASDDQGKSLVEDVLGTPDSLPISCLAALSPCTSTASIAYVASRSSSGIYEENSRVAFATRSESHQQHPSHHHTQYVCPHDTVIMGHLDGTLDIWAAGAVEVRQDNKRAVWTPICRLHCIDDKSKSKKNKSSSSDAGKYREPIVSTSGVGACASVVDVSIEDGASLLAACTSAGDVVVWETYEEEHHVGSDGGAVATGGLGYIEYARLKKFTPMTAAAAAAVAVQPAKKASEVTFNWDDSDDNGDSGSGSSEGEEDDDEEDDSHDEEDDAIVWSIKHAGKKEMPRELSESKMRVVKSKTPFENGADVGHHKHKYSGKHSGKHSGRHSGKHAQGAHNHAGCINPFLEYAEHESVQGKSFRPTAIREAFRVQLEDSAETPSCLLLIPSCLCLVVGTTTGGVYLSRGLIPGRFERVDVSAMWPTSAGSSSAVVGIVYSSFSFGDVSSTSSSVTTPEALTPAAYVIFSCQSVAVVCLQSGILIAFTRGSSIASAEGSNAGSSSGLSSLFRRASTAVYGGGVGGGGEATGKRAGVGATALLNDEKVVASCVMDVDCKVLDFSHCPCDDGRSRSSSGVSLSSEESATGGLPLRAARYLIVAMGSKLLRYNIARFNTLTSIDGKPYTGFNTISTRSNMSLSFATAAVDKDNKSAWNGSAVTEIGNLSSSGLKAGVQGGVEVERAAVIAGARLKFIPRITHGEKLGYIPALSVIDSTGTVTAFAVPHGNIVSSINLLEHAHDDLVALGLAQGVGNPETDSPPQAFPLQSGTLMHNGDCYLVASNGALFSCSLSKRGTHAVPGMTPSAVALQIQQVPAGSALLTGKEQKVADRQANLKSKQQSLFGGNLIVSSGPADLNKIFTKTRSSPWVSAAVTSSADGIGESGHSEHTESRLNILGRRLSSAFTPQDKSTPESKDTPSMRSPFNISIGSKPDKESGDTSTTPPRGRNRSLSDAFIGGTSSSMSGSRDSDTGTPRRGSFAHTDSSHNNQNQEKGLFASAIASLMESPREYVEESGNAEMPTRSAASPPPMSPNPTSPSPGAASLSGSNSSHGQPQPRSRVLSMAPPVNVTPLKSTMSETMRGLAERGERLSMLGRQSDDLQFGAQSYRDMMKAQRKELEKKAAKWGL